MSWAAVIIGGVSLAGSAIKYSQGSKQQKRAEEMNPTDPGPNQALIDNARLLRERYGNYQMPGLEAARADINQASQMAFDQGVQGASSSGDVLDLAARIAYGQQRNTNVLYSQNAQMKEQALADYLNANAQAGSDQTNWERSEYLREQQRQADLYNAGLINKQSAISEGLQGLGTAAAWKMTDPNASWNENKPGSDTRIVHERPGAEVVYTKPAPVAPVSTPFVTQTGQRIPKRNLDGTEITPAFINPVDYLKVRKTTAGPVTPTNALPYR